MTETALTPALRGARALVAVVLSVLLPGTGSCYLGRMTTAWLALAVAVCGPLLAAVLWRAELIGVRAVLALAGCALLLGHVGGAAGAAIEAWRGSVKRRFQTAVGYMLLATVLLIGLRTLSNQLLMSSFVVATIAMEPTFEYGDRVLVEPRPAGAAFRRGEVAIVRDPVSDEVYIRRVVALAGDQVELRGAELWIGGQPLASGTCPEVAAERCFVERSGDGLRYPVADAMGEAELHAQLTVPAGQVLVLRDRRDAHAPIEPLPADRLIGAVRVVWWSHNFGGVRRERIGRAPVLAGAAVSR